MTHLKSLYISLVLPPVALAIFGCSGTETQNPANNPNPQATFSNSGCKKETLAHALRTAQAEAVVGDAGVLDYGDEVAGLKCVAWQVTGQDQLKLSLINFDDACGAKWQGSTHVDAAGALTLSVSNPNCNIAKCGTCIYDWTFEVPGVSTKADLSLSMRVDTCPGQQDVKTANVQLPLSTQQNGIVCNYASFNGLGWQAMALHTCGQLGMPCQNTSMCQSNPPATELGCESGLSCIDNGTASQMICAKPCTVDADCGISGAQSCQANFCRPKTRW